ncbi:hypothetical protein B5X24_HaOG213301 [Helicoverpa armigera]|nr:hypothetical protein B5X24_HaOG213301 [Helicoverpa armigera]
MFHLPSYTDFRKRAVVKRRCRLGAAARARRAAAPAPWRRARRATRRARPRTRCARPRGPATTPTPTRRRDPSPRTTRACSTCCASRSTPCAACMLHLLNETTSYIPTTSEILIWVSVICTLG